MDSKIITQADLDNTQQSDHRWKFPGVTGPGTYTWNESQNRYESAQDTDENPHDFSHSGLGIGGLGSYEEQATVPTASQLRRMEQEDNAQRCKGCGGTEYTTGAMFTTAPSSGYCDDCFG